MKQENMKKTMNSQGIKRQLAAILALTSALVLTACGGGASNNQNPSITGGGGGPTYNGPAPANSDVISFRVQLWENIRGEGRCGSCHDAGGQGGNDFANNSNVNLAYDAANTVVNLSDPASSRMVTKFNGSGHFCWENSQSACQAQLELWITNWANDLNGSGGRTIQLTAPADETPTPARVFPATVPTTYYSGNGGINIHTLVTTYCSGCHVSNPTQSALPISPLFAVGTAGDPVTAQQSYDAARGVPLINLSVANASRFYTRLVEDGHNCFGASCAEAADEMLQAINYFMTAIPTPDMTELNSMVTSRAVSLFEDGIAASGGNRYEASQIALYEFKIGSGNTIIDRSGVSPSMNLTLSGTEGTDYTWLGSWGVTFKTDNAKAKSLSSNSTKLRNMIGSTGEYSIEAWVVPANVTQEDANIVSYSGGATSRNFTLGQHLYQYEMFNRNSANESENGEPQMLTDDNDEDLQASLQHVVVTYDPINGRRFYVNGNFTADLDPDPTGELNNWDSTYSLILGNESDNSRPWKGTIRLLSIHNRALTLDQVKQNYDVGVGQKFFLLFDVSQHLGAECKGPDPDTSTGLDYAPYCFIVMDVSQFDNYSFLFNAPKFININDVNNASAVPTALHIKGMRIGINGREVSNGQAFANLDVCVNGSACSATSTNVPYTVGTGASLSSIGTIIALDHGPNPTPSSGLQPDQIFLTFEKLSSITPSKSYAESYPITPDPMPTPTIATDVTMRTFEEINASLAAMTGISRTVTAINFDNSIDGTGANGTYTQVIQSLPSSANIKSFVPANQMGVTQLAISYCDQLVENTTAGHAFFDQLTFDGVSQPNLGFSSPTDRNKVIDPLLAHVLNYDGSTELSTMPPVSTVRADLDALMAGGTIGGATVTGLNTGCGTTCGYAATKKIIKATCAAAMASSPMLLK